jgi:hypothetical protein
MVKFQGHENNFKKTKMPLWLAARIRITPRIIFLSFQKQSISQLAPKTIPKAKYTLFKTTWLLQTQVTSFSFLIKTNPKTQ